jgi:small redox-active disulfide protein 2
MEAATSRTIRIGTANIGLIGLDIALNHAASANMTEGEAVEYLYSAVSKKNYIPSGAEKNYRKALREEFRRHMNIDVRQETGLVIRIFGTGCISCNNLQTQVIEVLNTMGLAADIEQIHDPDEIGRQGVIMTPALMVNGKVKSGGRPPTPAQIEQWIREAVQSG